MDGGESESRKRLRSELEKPRTLWSLMRIACWSTRDRTRAEDLVSETIVWVLEEDHPSWDGRGSFFSYMSFKLRNIFHETMSLRSSTEVAHDAIRIGDMVQTEEPRPDEMLERSRILREWDDLLGRLNSVLVKEDLKIARCLELMSEGRTAQEQAASLAWSMEQVYQAHRTIQRRGLEVRQAWDEEREAMMHARRAAIPPSEESRP
jgi:DNA-directed RNA polymerase specialized sigma24 family protein